MGARDGADSVRIRTAMTTSHLPVTLFILNPRETVAVAIELERPMTAYRAWHPVHGEERLVA